MTDAEAREVFNKAIAETADPDHVASLELYREYLTNGDFRRRLHDYMFELTYKPE